MALARFLNVDPFFSSLLFSSLYPLLQPEYVRIERNQTNHSYFLNGGHSDGNFPDIPSLLRFYHTGSLVSCFIVGCVFSSCTIHDWSVPVTLFLSFFNRAWLSVLQFVRADSLWSGSPRCSEAEAQQEVNTVVLVLFLPLQLKRIMERFLEVCVILFETRFIQQSESAVYQNTKVETHRKKKHQIIRVKQY